MRILPILLKDGYKTDHHRQYPPKTEEVYSNMTARRSRVPGVEYVIPFGMQYFVQEYLILQFNQEFFCRRLAQVLPRYERRIRRYLGAVATDHLAALHQLGYLPLEIKAMPEGTKVPLRVPIFTIRNTRPEFGWLTNMLETLLSNVLWLPATSATTAYRYRETFERFARETGGDPAFVKWQGHDFSFRGMAGVEAACLSGAAHLLSFTGTDTIPAIDFLEEYYFADADAEVVGGSVPATEHSVMCMGGPGGELETIRRLITEVYPTGIVSIVCDTWDLWKVVTEYLPALKDIILARDGKVVVRPDSGDPVDIICGASTAGPLFVAAQTNGETERAVADGAVATLMRHFGARHNARGFLELDPHVGLIYGDSITPERQKQILTRLAAKGFASTNVVLGIGSYTYQYVTRDTYGFAMKATHGVVDGQPIDIYKDPKTDDGTKRSATGRLCVREQDGRLVCDERVSLEGEAGGLLRTVFLNGEARNTESLGTIRARIDAQLQAVATC